MRFREWNQHLPFREHGHLVLTEGEEELLPADLEDAKSRADFGDDRAHITAMNLKLLSRRQGLF